ncbi:hypothetical protein NP493_5114g00000 [Ridgeia piscesae]|uniref:Uncharacterized protein n=1 Tax=Ridgeia piscesae TaxID=27915 RepID=A0AAD9MQ28_RIDPI|nr:hypothetical protein NP493_5114g00000 [Ridgeia piscesae]
MSQKMCCWKSFRPLDGLVDVTRSGRYGQEIRRHVSGQSPWPA